MGGRLETVNCGLKVLLLRCIATLSVSFSYNRGFSDGKLTLPGMRAACSLRGIRGSVPYSFLFPALFLYYLACIVIFKIFLELQFAFINENLFNKIHY